MCRSRSISLLSVPWTLACEDGNSKLFGVVTVADVDAEKRVDDSLVQIWRLKFGHKVFSSEIEHEVWSRF